MSSSPAKSAIVSDNFRMRCDDQLNGTPEESIISFMPMIIAEQLHTSGKNIHPTGGSKVCRLVVFNKQTPPLEKKGSGA